jgi:hypothetical protein
MQAMFWLEGRYTSTYVSAGRAGMKGRIGVVERKRGVFGTRLPRMATASTQSGARKDKEQGSFGISRTGG